LNALRSSSQANAPWPLCPLLDQAAAGLPAASKVRFKLFTLDHRLVRGQLGRLSAADQARVTTGLAQLLGVAAVGAGESPFNFSGQLPINGLNRVIPRCWHGF